MKHHRDAVLVAAVLLGSVSDARGQTPGTIWVVGGTYGRSCGVPHGNKTLHLARACNGKRSCTYTIDYRVIGDPRRGCSKDYLAEWRCIGSPRVHQANVTPEAGFKKRVRLSCAGAPGAAPPAHGGGGGGHGGVIQIVAGTYGGNCGARHGNKTRHLARACNGRAHCRYTINYRVIGDPRRGCSKDYVAEWRCSGSRRVHRATAPPEAGFNKKLTLSCSRPPRGARRPGGRIRVLAGTYGGNCGARHGNKTRHLARACDGRAHCRYTIDYRVIGDPRRGCSKDYVAEWSCGGSGRKRRAVVSPEAGFSKKVLLRCD